MELVKTRGGIIPNGRHPVVVGYTAEGIKEYFARVYTGNSTYTRAIAEGAVRSALRPC